MQCQKTGKSAEIQAVSTWENCCWWTKVKAARVRHGSAEWISNSCIRYDLTWSSHLQDLALSEIFMIRGKHQRFTVQHIYFPTVGWDIKERVAFRFLWFDAAICHTWLNSWNLCVHACTCVCIQPTPVLCWILAHTLYLFIFLLSCIQGHLPSSCQDIHSLNGPIPDSEHFLNIQGKALKVRLYDLIIS